MIKTHTGASQIEDSQPLEHQIYTYAQVIKCEPLAVLWPVQPLICGYNLLIFSLYSGLAGGVELSLYRRLYFVDTTITSHMSN